MKSSLSFNNYNILETIYRYDPFNKLEEEDVSPSFSLNIKYEDETCAKAILILKTELGDKALEDNSFYLKAVIIGFFSLEIGDEAQEGFIENMYRKNALAILYPYMRSLVSDLSSKGNETPIILPPINVGAMMEKEGEIKVEYSSK
ncbi:protein-export chaperone SecB [Salipaludibacillus sp. CF4.18]|uniref:protein-export chaperone SecB n=1 Tax=Salipaludibacillus sp. CF4.18 TaxID=3373081 RepID=UPI003EE72227